MDYLQYILKRYVIEIYQKGIDLNHDYISEQHRYYLNQLITDYKTQINKKIHRSKETNIKCSEHEIYAEIGFTDDLLYRISRLIKIMLYGNVDINLINQSIKIFNLGQLKQSIFAEICTNISKKYDGTLTIFDELNNHQNLYCEMICGIELIKQTKPKLKQNVLLTSGFEVPQLINELKKYTIDELNFLCGCLDCYQLEPETISKNISRFLS